MNTFQLVPTLTPTDPTTANNMVRLRPIASDKLPKPSAPKNKPVIKILVEIDETGIAAVSHSQ